MCVCVSAFFISSSSSTCLVTTWLSVAQSALPFGANYLPIIRVLLLLDLVILMAGIMFVCFFISPYRQVSILQSLQIFVHGLFCPPR